MGFFLRVLECATRKVWGAGALIFRIRLWDTFYFNYNNEPPHMVLVVIQALFWGFREQVRVRVKGSRFKALGGS